MAKMFQIAVKDKGGYPHFLLVDVASNDPTLLFRADFKPIPWTPPDMTEGKEAIVGHITQELTSNKPADQKENSTETTGKGMTTRTDPSSSSLKVDEQESSDEVEDGGGVKRKRKRKASKKKAAPKAAKKAKPEKAPSKKKAPAKPRGKKGKRLPSGPPTQVVISNAHHAGYTSRILEGHASYTPAARDNLLRRRTEILARLGVVLDQLSSHMHDDDDSQLKEELASLNAELLKLNEDLAAKFGGLGIGPIKQKRKPMGHGIVQMPPKFYETVRHPMDAVRKARLAIAYMTKTGQIS